MHFLGQHLKNLANIHQVRRIICRFALLSLFNTALSFIYSGIYQPVLIIISGIQSVKANKSTLLSYD